MNVNQINTQLDKNAKKSMDRKMDALIEEVISEIENRKGGMTEDEFMDWWQKNKKDII